MTNETPSPQTARMPVPMPASAWAPRRRPTPDRAEKTRALLLAMLRQGRSIGLAQTAAGLTFLSMLAIVPTLSIALTVLAALPMFAPLREALQGFIESNLFLPSFARTLTEYVSRFAAQAEQLSLFGALVFFATAFTALLTIDRTLNAIWVAERPRSIGRRITLYWTLLTLGPLLIALSAAVNGMVMTDWLKGLPLHALQRIWYVALSWSIGVVGLTLIYYLLPNVRVRWRDALMGALLAAVVIEVLRRGLTVYVANLPTYTIVYGAFAALPLFLIWMYMVWLTVLMGALLAANLPHWSTGMLIHARWSPAQRFEAAGAILLELTGAWRRDGAGLRSVESLRELTGPDPLRADEFGRLLAGNGYIHRHWRLASNAIRGEPDRAVWDEQWVLAATPERLTLRRLFESVWHSRGVRSSRADRQFALRQGPSGRAPLAPTDVRRRLTLDAPLLDQPLAQLTGVTQATELTPLTQAADGPSQTTPASRNLAMSAADSPAAASTSSVSSPSIGGARS